MKSKIQFATFLVLMVVAPFVNGQQMPSFNLYNNQRFLLNPAYAGGNEFLQGFLNSKRQWVGVNNAPVTNVFGLHQAVNEKMGLGILITSDKAALIEQLSGNLNYSYKVKFSNTKVHSLSMGVSLGFIDNKLLLSNANGDSNDPLVLAGDNDGISIDAAFGARYNYSDFELAFAIPQLLNAPVSYTRFAGDDQKFDLKSHFILMTGYSFHFYESHPDASGNMVQCCTPKLTIEPSVLFRAVPYIPAQVDVNLMFRNASKQWLGLTYRPTNGGMVVSAGLPVLEGLHVGYGYEFSNSKLAAYSTGTHEFSIIYNFRNKKDTKKDDQELKDMLDKQLAKQKADVKTQVDSLNYELARLKASTDADVTNHMLRTQLEKLQLEMIQMKAQQGSAQGTTTPVSGSANSDAMNSDLRNQVNSLQDELTKLKTQPQQSSSGANSEGLDNLKRELEELRRYVKTIKGEDVVELKTEKDANNNDVLVEKDYRDGCYVVIHSLRSLENAKNAVRIESDKGNSASILFNKTRQWYYIYTHYDAKLQPALETMKEVRKSVQPEAWVHIYRH